MKTEATRNTVLALAGLLALGVYVLACTSFSPDDKKVLYPSVEPESGAVGIGVYDRAERRSDMLFLPLVLKTGKEVEPPLMRAQWLDGRSVLVAWTGPDKSEDLNLAVIAWEGRASFRMFSLPGIKDATAKLMLPVCATGGRVFVMESARQLVRLDLKTGDATRHDFADVTGKLSVYPSLKGDRVYYLEEPQEQDQGRAFGLLNPDTFARNRLLVITNEVGDGSFFTYTDGAAKVAFIEKTSHGTNRLVVLQDGKPAFTRGVADKGEELSFGNAVFSTKGDVLWASFQRKVQGQSDTSFGLMEIPLNDAPVRRTVLISGTEADDGVPVLCFQAGISHDGKIAAMASTYLACVGKGLKAEDCALFFVDLSDPTRNVTKVPVAAPKRGFGLPGK